MRVYQDSEPEYISLPSEDRNLLTLSFMFKVLLSLDMKISFPIDPPNMIVHSILCFY